MIPKNSPVLFVGHGSPMNAISDNDYTQALIGYSKTIIQPEAIIVISAHWQTNGTFITGANYPEQIYDFYGFPDELYDVKYAPAGLSELAKKIESDKIGIKVDGRRGIDHAGWAVVKHLYPDQNIPLLELSLDVNKSFEEHFELAKKLIKYRSDNILFIGSGNIVHNLQVIDFDEKAKPYQWAIEIDQWFKKQIDVYDIGKIINYAKYLSNHKLAIPTNEHYLPLLYTLGMKLQDEKINIIHESIQNGSISMRSIEICP